MTSITITKGAVDTPLYLKMLNRHGLIAGATGTGKTVTLKVLTEKFSQQTELIKQNRIENATRSA